MLGKTWAPIKDQEMMYKAVVQAVIIYGSEICVVTDVMVTFLEGFHHRIARQITGMMARGGKGGEWKWALVDAVLEVTGIWPIRAYVRRRQKKIAEYVAGSLIYEIYTGAERMEGSSSFLRWWDQEHIPTQA